MSHTVLLVASKHIDMDVISVVVIRRVKVCEFRQERAWIFGERMEVQAVYAYCDALVHAVNSICDFTKAKCRE